jgi:hypothetical protein
LSRIRKRQIARHHPVQSPPKKLGFLPVQGVEQLCLFSLWSTVSEDVVKVVADQPPVDGVQLIRPHENVLGVVPVLMLESSTLEKALAKEEILEMSTVSQKSAPWT